MRETEVRQILKKLAKKQPIFIDEKDFQYSLASKIKQAIPNSIILLEGRPLRIESDYNYDICLFCKDTEVYFELKYKPAKLDAKVNSNKYELRHHAANDLYSYDFFYDAKKLEQVMKRGKCTGIAIFLTNDSLYWRGAKESSAYYHFRLENQRTIKSHKSYSWTKNKEKKGKGRQLDIVLNYDYILNWQDYAMIDKGEPKKNSQFRYLLLEITGS